MLKTERTTYIGMFEVLSTEAEIHGFQELAQQVDQRRRDADEPLLVMVAGEGKHGKSTLINGLVGKDVAPVGRLPKTWKIDLYEAHEGPEEAVLYWLSRPDDHDTVSIPEAMRICEDEEKKWHADERSSSTWKSDLYQVRWRINVDWPGQDMVLVDTPGFAQLRVDTSIERMKLYGSSGIQITSSDGFEHYYARADVVLWCINGSKLEDQDTLDALVKVSGHNKLVVGVLTRMDQVPQEQWERVRSRAREVYGSYIPEFLFAAAGAKSEEIRQQSVSSLRKVVQEKFAARAAKLKEASYQQEYQRDFESLSLQLDGIMACYLENVSTRKQALSGLDRMVREPIERARGSIDRIWDDAQRAAKAKLVSLWERSGGDVAAFSRLVDREALDRPGLDRDLSRAICSVHEEMKANLTAFLGQLEWQGIAVGGQAVTTFATGLEELGFDDLDLRSSQFSGLQISGNEGVAVQNAVGVAAGVLGAIVLGPLGILVGLIGILAGSAARRSEVLSKAEAAICDFCNTSKRSFEDQFGGTSSEWLKTVTTIVERSFSEHHGRDLEGIWDHAGEADGSLNKLHCWLGDKENVPWPYCFVPDRLMQSENDAGTIPDPSNTQLRTCYQFGLAGADSVYQTRWKNAVTQEWEQTTGAVLHALVDGEDGPFGKKNLDVMASKFESYLAQRIRETLKGVHEVGHDQYSGSHAVDDLKRSGMIDWLIERLPRFSQVSEMMSKTRMGALAKTVDVNLESQSRREYEASVSRVRTRLVQNMPSAQVKAVNWYRSAAIALAVLASATAAAYAVNSLYYVYYVELSYYWLIPVALPAWYLAVHDYRRQQNRQNESVLDLARQILSSVRSNACACSVLITGHGRPTLPENWPTMLTTSAPSHDLPTQLHDEIARMYEDTDLQEPFKERARLAQRCMNGEVSGYAKQEMESRIEEIIRSYSAPTRNEQLKLLHDSYPVSYKLGEEYYSQYGPMPYIESHLRQHGRQTAG